MTLDRKKLTAIGHADHVICNPVSPAKVDEVLDLLDLPAGARVLDAGCGKAEILMRLIEKRGVSAVGVDMNARFLDEARRRAVVRVPPDSIHLIEMDVTVYLREGTGSGSGGATRPPAPFEAAICTGSTHAFGGYRQTLRALAKAVRPGGLLLVGEGYWKKDPHADYLAAIGASKVEFTDHAGNVARGVEEGLIPMYTAVSSDDEWDHYEGRYLLAVERYVAAHPEDPDSPGLRDHIRRWRDAYLRWGRETLGFGLYLFRTLDG